MNNALEASKFFPYIAWTVIVGFAAFVFMLTLRVQAELEEIGDGIQRLEQRLDTIDPKADPAI